MITRHSDHGYRRMADGVEMRNLVHGAGTMMVRFNLAAGSVLPLHSHPHEQTGLLLSGRAHFTIAGDTTEVGPGDAWCVPGGIEHAFAALEDCVAIEVFSPLREEYLP
ncbi:MAG: cupin domain-containing protein [Deinococcales bacterium]